jgi:hypothetical protein
MLINTGKPHNSKKLLYSTTENDTFQKCMFVILERMFRSDLNFQTDLKPSQAICSPKTFS